jgi:hypothetical protein
LADCGLSRRGTDVGSVLKDVVIDFYLLASPEIL